MSTVYVNEETEDRGEHGNEPWALGRFSAHAQGPELPDWTLEGPQSAPVEDALAWARAQSSRVVIRYCAPEGEPAEFSAGAERVRDEDDQPLPVWPPEGLDLRERREPSWWFVDRSPDDPPISWDVLVSVYTLEDDRQGADPAAVVSALRPALDVLEWRRASKQPSRTSSTPARS